jgi:hypothetical protein
MARYLVMHRYNFTLLSDSLCLLEMHFLTTATAPWHGTEDAPVTNWYVDGSDSGVCSVVFLQYPMPDVAWRNCGTPQDSCPVARVRPWTF